MGVVIVEEEKGPAESMRRGLIGEGFVVDVVHDGVSGLWAATEFSYDVAILDIMLPGLNGYRVLEHIREREIWTPVMMLTAKDGEYDQTDALDLGADDYLTKPFSFMVLVARLRALIRRGAPGRPNKLTVGSPRPGPAPTRGPPKGRADQADCPRVQPAQLLDAECRQRRRQIRHLEQ